MLQDFSRDTGIDVRYEIMDSNELLERQVGCWAARVTTWYSRLPVSSNARSKRGSTASWTSLSCPNLRNLDPDITAKLGKFDPGNEHSAIYMWGTSGVAYNEATLKTIMPDAPVNSFAMLYDPTVVSKFAECGVSLLDAPSEVVGTVLLYLGKDANSEKPRTSRQPRPC